LIAVFRNGAVKLVVGLGNPGQKYERTRHNLGFWVVDHVAGSAGTAVSEELCHALIGEFSSDGQRVLLAKPQTYMNRSGAVVKALLGHFETGAENLVVVYDDLDLPFGRIRIRPEGGAGGHRGMLSIIETLVGAQFYRVRVGIGRPPEGVDPADFVLEPFAPDEAERITELVSRASQSVVCLLREGGQRAMEEFNRPL
jgi:peptidyl-tRNA hydrolase, PTH1 family